MPAFVDHQNPSKSCLPDRRPRGVRAPARACHAGAWRLVYGVESNAGALPRNQRSSCAAISRVNGFRNAHSQTIATRQPASRRSRRLRWSRSVFASNFALQNLSRVAGVVVYGQPACRCQKQPCTKHTAPNRRNTRSGVPGSLRSCKRYRSPRAWMARRRATSGRVSLLPIPAIMRERVARSTMSAIFVPFWALEDHLRHQTTREVSDVIQVHGTQRLCTEAVTATPVPKSGRRKAPVAPAMTGRSNATREANCPGRGSFRGSGRTRGGLFRVPKTVRPPQVPRRPLHREGPSRPPHLAATCVPAQVRG